MRYWWYKFYLRAAITEAAQNSSQQRYVIFRVNRLYTAPSISYTTLIAVVKVIFTDHILTQLQSNTKNTHYSEVA